VADSLSRTGRIHLGLVLAEVICIPAFVIEILRALGGNTLSWAYVFEWPLFGGYAVYMWRQLLRQERGEVVGNKQRATPVDQQAATDAAMARWNAYLSSAHAADGTPPPSEDA
jgi:hypothetical protein